MVNLVDPLYLDAEAIAEAVARPTMRFVPIKTDDQLDMQSLHRVREPWVMRRTAVVNQTRGLLLERFSRSLRGAGSACIYVYAQSSLEPPGKVFGPSNADFFDLKKQSKSFSATTLFAQTTYNLAGNGRAERVGAAKVDADFLRTLEVAPELGRGFDQRDEPPGNDHVAVISHALWLTVLGGRADVLGSTLSLDGVSYQVIGMMPEEFAYPQKRDLAYGNGHVETTDVWVPSALTPQQKADREASNGYAVARLRPGVTVREAQAEMDTIMSHLNLLHNPDTRGWGAFVKPLRDSALWQVRPLMWLLMGTVGFVLLIACGNAANLLLARAAARSHELGVRATLGARRSRLLRQMLTGSLMLSAAAGTVGVGLAWLFLHALLSSIREIFRGWTMHGSTCV